MKKKSKKSAKKSLKKNVKKPVEKSVEIPIEEQVEMAAKKDIEKPVEKSVEIPIEEQVEMSAKKDIGKPVEKSVEIPIAKQIKTPAKNNKQLVPILILLVPTIAFFLINALTPFVWDDFLMACQIVKWNDPKTALNRNLHDIIVSTMNMHKNWHGRDFVNFFNFLVMMPRKKTLFNIANTIFYFLLSLASINLICEKNLSSKKEKWNNFFAYLAFHAALWLFIPAYGENFLWLTAAINYLWTSTMILIFLTPFFHGFPQKLKKLQFLWLLVGLMAGCSMENSATAGAIMLFVILMKNIFQQKRPHVFEILGTIGYYAGYYSICHARQRSFVEFNVLMKNFKTVFHQFFEQDKMLLFALAICIVIDAAVKIHRKKKPDFFLVSLLLGIFASVAAMSVPGYFGGRSCFFTQLLLILAIFRTAMQFKSELLSFATNCAFAIMIWTSVSSFPSAFDGILSNYIISLSREKYIEKQIAKGVKDLKCKTRLKSDDRHNVFYGCNDFRLETHNNTAKAVFYEVKTIKGINRKNQPDVKKVFENFKTQRKVKKMTFDDFLTMLYNSW